MNNKDLNKINSLIQMYEELPQDGNLKTRTIFGEITEEEKKAVLKIIDDSDELFRRLFAFIKVKFGEESQYYRSCLAINFDPKIGGLKIMTTDRSHVKRSHEKGMRDLGDLLKNMKAEIIERLEDLEEKDNNIKHKVDNKVNHITNSNVIIGDKNYSQISKNEVSKNDNIKPTKKWQKIAVGVAITIFILGIIFSYLIYKTII